jgi:predicted AAA+ superfamily ATPase
LNIIRRNALEQVISRLKSNPVVALLGPRQCGKTTLAMEVVCVNNLVHFLKSPHYY